VTRTSAVLGAGACALAGLLVAAGALHHVRAFTARAQAPTPSQSQPGPAPPPSAVKCEKYDAHPPKLDPYTGNPQAIAEGKQLFQTIGCSGCHGTQGGGGMGPPLNGASQWRYGASDACFFETIYGGRPGGMPAWGKMGKLTPDQIWKVIAFLRTLYKGDPSKIVW
jgi:cytochrome c(L)